MGGDFRRYFELLSRERDAVETQTMTFLFPRPSHLHLHRDTFLLPNQHPLLVVYHLLVRRSSLRKLSMLTCSKTMPARIEFHIASMG
jgi:hypothetical protein